MQKIIEIKNLSVGYGRKVVVSNINQQILRGQFIALIGPNGSGKTTILKTLSRLISPLAGSVYIDGKELINLSSNEIAKKMATVLTERPNPGLLKGYEFVSLGRYPYTDLFGRLSKEDKDKIYEALRLVHAEHLSNRYFGELSDGERQKLILARAIAQDPDVIFLDEPTLHLDLKSKMEILNILYMLSRKKGITIVSSIHDIDIALKISDTVWLIKDGRILDAGPPEKIIDEKRINELYGLKEVCFNSILCNIELRLSENGSGRPIFVIAGAGKGAPIYRAHIKRGYRIITGIVHENDIDYQIAKTLGLEIISEKPFSRIKEESIKKAIDYINKADFVIDSGFPIGSENMGNLMLIKYAIKAKKKLFSLRKKEELLKYMDNADGIIFEKVDLFDQNC